MSLVAMAQIAASLTTIFEDQITSQINRATVLLQVLPVGPGVLTVQLANHLDASSLELAPGGLGTVVDEPDGAA